MALPNSRTDREYKKFVETDDGNTAIRTISVGSLLDGFVYDSVVASYPAGDTEVFEFKTGGVSGTLVATVTVTYTDATKESISSAVRT